MKEGGCQASQLRPPSSTVCPICCEMLPGSDERFSPCVCHYQICIWCYNKIKLSDDPRCPWCRRTYTGDWRMVPPSATHSSNMDDFFGDTHANLHSSPSNHEDKDGGEDDDDANLLCSSSTSSSSYYNDNNNGNRLKQHCGEHVNEEQSSAPRMCRTNNENGSSQRRGQRTAAGGRLARPGSRKRGSPQQQAIQQNTALGSSSEKVNLRDMRVVRRDLCYVVGLPLDAVADENALRDFRYFGKYGTVLNVIVNRNPNFKSPDKKRSCAVYVTFSKRGEAKSAILDMNNKLFDGRKLRASYGTTKYCSNFLKGVRCQNRQCFYLHEKGADGDSFTVDQLKQIKESSRTLTCSALMAEEFNEPCEAFYREESLFGWDMEAVIDFYVQCESFDVTKCLVLPNVAHKIDKIRTMLAQHPMGRNTPRCRLLAQDISLSEEQASVSKEIDAGEVFGVADILNQGRETISLLNNENDGDIPEDDNGDEDEVDSDNNDDDEIVDDDEDEDDIDEEEDENLGEAIFTRHSSSTSLPSSPRGGSPALVLLPPPPFQWETIVHPALKKGWPAKESRDFVEQNKFFSTTTTTTITTGNIGNCKQGGNINTMSTVIGLVAAASGGEPTRFLDCGNELATCSNIPEDAVVTPPSMPASAAVGPAIYSPSVVPAVQPLSAPSRLMKKQEVTAADQMTYSSSVADAPPGYLQYAVGKLVYGAEMDSDVAVLPPPPPRGFAPKVTYASTTATGDPRFQLHHQFHHIGNNTHHHPAHQLHHHHSSNHFQQQQQQYHHHHHHHHHPSNITNHQHNNENTASSNMRLETGGERAAWGASASYISAASAGGSI